MSPLSLYTCESVQVTPFHTPMRSLSLAAVPCFLGSEVKINIQSFHHKTIVDVLDFECLGASLEM